MPCVQTSCWVPDERLHCTCHSAQKQHYTEFPVWSHGSKRSTFFISPWLGKKSHAGTPPRYAAAPLSPPNHPPGCTCSSSASRAPTADPPQRQSHRLTTKTHECRPGLKRYNPICVSPRESPRWKRSPLLLISIFKKGPPSSGRTDLGAAFPVTIHRYTHLGISFHAQITQ